ncbi:unannotated protein [freshwater metagenome]|uniref:Unannotated protein n=1 Tax=freshwater metagenome TaxID=449393 RepID=A0A6J7IPI8_9ZZZZ
MTTKSFFMGASVEVHPHGFHCPAGAIPASAGTR